jgi:hypothetical protein
MAGLFLRKERPMNRQVFISLLVTLLLVAAGGCAASRSAAPAPQTSRGVAPSGGAPAAPPALEAKPSTDNTGQAVNQPEAANAAGAEQMIVYTGQLSLVVKDTNAVVDQITQIVKDAGGFVLASNTFKDQGHARATMTIRVPGEDLTQLTGTLAKVKALAITVESENLTGQDVTDQYADTQAQIENLTAQRDSYRTLLDRATKMEDILNIQTRLDQVQGQINTLTGQQLKLKESVKFATVNITITPDELAQPIQVAGWRPEGTARDAFRALLNALEFIGNALIWGGICVLPVALLIGVPIFLVIRFALSRRKKAAPKPQA